MRTPSTAQGTTRTSEGKESSSGLYGCVILPWVIIHTVPIEKVMKRICEARSKNHAGFKIARTSRIAPS